MKRILLSLMLCASMVVSLSPMKRKREITQDQQNVPQHQCVQDQDTFNLVGLFQIKEAFCVVVCNLEGKAFSTLNQVSTSFYNFCSQVNPFNLSFTFADAACHGNAQLTSKFLTNYKHDGMLFIPDQDAASREFKISDFGLGKVSLYSVAGQKVFKSTYDVDTFGVCYDYVFFLDFGPKGKVAFSLASPKHINCLCHMIKKVGLGALKKMIDDPIKEFYTHHGVTDQEMKSYDTACIHNAEGIKEHIDSKNEHDIIISSHLFTNAEQVVCHQHGIDFPESGSNQCELLCLNMIFILAAQHNHLPVVQAILANDYANDCLSALALWIANRLSTDDTIKQIIHDLLGLE